MRGGRNRRSECHQHRGGVPNHEHKLVEADLPCITEIESVQEPILVGLHISAELESTSFRHSGKLKSTTEIRLEPDVYTAAETVRNPQLLQQCHMIDGIKCSGQVEECQSSKSSTVHCTENVSQNLQHCCFRRVMSTIGGLHVG